MTRETQAKPSRRDALTSLSCDAHMPESILHVSTPSSPSQKVIWNQAPKGALSDSTSQKISPIGKEAWRALDNQWDNVLTGVVSLQGEIDTIPTKGAYSRMLSENKLRMIEEKEKRNLLMDYQRKNAHTQSMRSCNRVPILAISKDGVKYDDIVCEIEVSKKGYRIVGMITCDNPYCVHCSWVRKTKRAKRIQEGIKHFQSKGYTGYFVTLTMPRSDYLNKQLDVISRGWKNIQRTLDRNNIKYHTVRALDTTFSDEQSKGTYHVHIHAIVMAKERSLDKIDHLITKAWIGSSPSSSLACQKVEKIRCLIKLSRYCSKMAGIALEIGSSATKTEAKGWKSKSLPDLIMRAIEGCPWAIFTYRDFLETMHRKKSLTFSKYWPQLEEEEEEEEEKGEKLSLKVPYIWHLVAAPFYDDIGLLCWSGEMQGLSPLHPRTNHIGRGCFNDFEELFSHRTPKEISELYGCAPLDIFALMEQDIKDFLQSYHDELLDARFNSLRGVNQ